MATAATLRRVDVNLHDLELEVDDLPDLAEAWDTLSDSNQVSYFLEWDDLMDRLDFLEKAHLASDMTPAQEKRYKALLVQLKKHEPLIKRLELSRPKIAKWDKEATS